MRGNLVQIELKRLVAIYVSRVSQILALWLKIDVVDSALLNVD